MSAGSGASNLGYGNIVPLSNVNSSYVNINNSNYPGNFSSNEIPGTPPGPLPGLAGAKNNVDAAASIVPGFKGGAKIIKRKIKNITKQYKRMKSGSRKIKSIKRKLRNKTRSRKYSGGMFRRRFRRSISRGRAMHGGYSQYQNNLPMTQTYQVAGINLPASQLGLANPPPIAKLANCTNCVDNYNHYTNKGFPSQGH
jgi:hypothetical protein